MLTSSLAPADRLVLDTHVWVWISGEAGGPEQLHPSVPAPIEAAARARRLFASAASAWEIALKAERGQALISGDLNAWMQEQRRFPGIRILSIDTRLAIASTRMPRWIRARDGQEHRDPNDRFITATARRLNAVVLTCDGEILEYARQGHVRAFDARP
jgi:PIN domain nuclease of toxin-antitoxin system